MEGTLVIAHRGFRSKYPENTMLSFEKAIALKVDGIEFDVHLSKDGKPVIIHDETLERTCKKSGFVKDFYFDELIKMNAAAYFKQDTLSMPIYETIPSLENYLELVKKSDIISNIELKTGIFEYKGIEEKVYTLITKYGLKEKCIISSFNHESVLRMKKIDNSVACAFLTDSWDIAPALYLKNYGINFYHPPAYRLTKEFIDSLHEHGIRVNAWLSSVKPDYKKLLDTGVDGIITDYPDKVLAL